MVATRRSSGAARPRPQPAHLGGQLGHLPVDLGRAAVRLAAAGGRPPGRPRSGRPAGSRAGPRAPTGVGPAAPVVAPGSVRVVLGLAQLAFEVADRAVHALLDLVGQGGQVGDGGMDLGLELGQLGRALGQLVPAGGR